MATLVKMSDILINHVTSGRKPWLKAQPRLWKDLRTILSESRKTVWLHVSVSQYFQFKLPYVIPCQNLVSAMQI